MYKTATVPLAFCLMLQNYHHPSAPVALHTGVSLLRQTSSMVPPIIAQLHNPLNGPTTRSRCPLSCLNTELRTCSTPEQRTNALFHPKYTAPSNAQGQSSPPIQPTSCSSRPNTLLSGMQSPKPQSHSSESPIAEMLRTIALKPR